MEFHVFETACTLYKFKERSHFRQYESFKPNMRMDFYATFSHKFRNILNSPYTVKPLTVHCT